jgi:hypothetical protein
LETPFISQENGIYRPNLTHLSQNSASSSSVHSASSTATNAPIHHLSGSGFGQFQIDQRIWAAPQQEEDPKEKEVFDPIHRRYDNYCDNFFV